MPERWYSKTTLPAIVTMVRGPAPCARTPTPVSAARIAREARAADTRAAEARGRAADEDAGEERGVRVAREAVPGGVELEAFDRTRAR